MEEEELFVEEGELCTEESSVEEGELCTEEDV
jgi:hypothetical protein